MSTTNEIVPHTKVPKTTYLKNYQTPFFFIQSIDLTFELLAAHTVVHARLKLERNQAYSHKQSELVLDGKDLVLHSVALNGRLLADHEYQVTEHHLHLFNMPDQATIEIVTHIYPEQNKALSGLYYSRGIYCTQCEAEGFRRITYYLDRPDVLASYTTTIIADKKSYPYLLSNGNLVEHKELPDGRHQVRWEDPFKKPSYLFALVAGDFDVVEDMFKTLSGREVALKIYVEKGYRDQAHHALFSLKEAMKWDEETFAREYDLDIYMIVATHDFNMGAMENKGLNIFNTKYILANNQTATDNDYLNILSVIGHEYFHNWSGNRVTCRDWFQLSLKEGLTIFRDQLFSQDLVSPSVMRIRDVRDLRETQFPEDAGPLAHPVRPDSYIEINNFYTATVYNKGAEVLRMMQTILGKALFAKGLDLYFSRYDGQAVTIEDFVLTMEEVAHIDLTQFRLWYTQAGTPIIQVQDEYDALSKTYQLHMQQVPAKISGQNNELPFHVPIRMALLDQQGNELRLDCQDGEITSEKVLSLTQTSQTFTFYHVLEKPIASLFRGFSAPIKLNTMQKTEDLLFLFKHDHDAFNRYEAGQRYILQIIFRLIESSQANEALIMPEELIAAWDYQLSHVNHDPFLMSELLRLPSERYIGEQMSVVDVVAIHIVREFLLQELAQSLESRWLQLYEHYAALLQNRHEFDIEQIGKRQFKNLSLFYLMRLPHHIDLALGQFERALSCNMTDTQAALQCMVDVDSDKTRNALNDFYQTFSRDELVVGKWFSMQASSKLPSTLQHIKELCQHPAFDLKNPNKVYALIASFTHNNMINFHAANGEGYRFLAQIIRQLDAFNPQMAARMVKPLTMWRRYDKERQIKICDELNHLLQSASLSNDVYELVSKCLH